LLRLEGLCDTARMAQDRMGVPTDRHREAFEALQTAILEGDGLVVTTAEMRRGAAERGDVPERLAAYVDAIHDHAYRISDRTVTDLRAAGASEDEVFEVTVSAAFGAARERLEAGLAAVRGAARAT
jgi:alkylhydroperoxidase family enzyme